LLLILLKVPILFVNLWYSHKICCDHQKFLFSLSWINFPFLYVIRFISCGYLVINSTICKLSRSCGTYLPFILFMGTPLTLNIWGYFYYFFIFFEWKEKMVDERDVIIIILDIFYLIYINSQYSLFGWWRIVKWLLQSLLSGMRERELMW